MKKLLLLLKTIGKGFAFAVSAYLLAAGAGMLYATEKQESEQDEIEVYLISSGLHIDIVFPLAQGPQHWAQYLPDSATKGGAQGYEYVAIGWGSREFYLNTPSWDDLSMESVLIAGTGTGSAAIHATYYRSLRTSENCKRLMLSPKEYEALCKFVKGYFVEDQNAKPKQIPNQGYWHNDAFYEANGTYSALHTCNTWANNALKACGQKACLWTPFAVGVMRHY